MNGHFEIERRYLIRYPDIEKLNKIASNTRIEQTYLLKEDGWNTNRIRMRGADAKYTYTHTRKKRLSELTRLEDEHEISLEEYTRLLKQADPSRNVIRKNRYCLEHKGKLFEIDVFDFWRDRAIMEIELGSEGEEFELPPDIEIVREISADKRYSNSSLAREIPEELI